MDFENFVLQLSPSDLIQIAGIIVSLICSLIAIAISLKTLKQNSKMIENSTRPYIGIYIASTVVKTLISVRNFRIPYLLRQASDNIFANVKHPKSALNHQRRKHRYSVVSWSFVAVHDLDHQSCSGTGYSQTVYYRLVFVVRPCKFN